MAGKRLKPGQRLTKEERAELEERLLATLRAHGPLSMGDLARAALNEPASWNYGRVRYSLGRMITAGLVSIADDPGQPARFEAVDLPPAMDRETLEAWLDTDPTQAPRVSFGNQ